MLPREVAQKPTVTDEKASVHTCVTKEVEEEQEEVEEQASNRGRRVF
jgi:hypothetical protein